MADNKTIVRDAYGAFSRGDIDAVLSAFAEDAVWELPGGAPFCGRRMGADQIRQFFAEMEKAVQIDQFDVDDLVSEGDKVIVLGRERFTVRETGRHVEQRWAHAYTFRGGKIAEAFLYDDSHAVASAFGESTRERQALTGSLGLTHPAFSGRGAPTGNTE